ncbi:MAG: ATP-dependent nuclease [Pirellulales bacterium]
MIRLHSLSIKNFRGIREGQIDGFADVNVLVGRNNSGKTTLIEAITRAATTGGLQQDVFGRNVEQLWQQARSSLPITRAVRPPNRQQQKASAALGIPNSAAQVGDGESLLFYRQDRSREIDIAVVLRSEGHSAKGEHLTYKHTAEKLPGAPRAQAERTETSLDPHVKQMFCGGITVFRPADAFNAAVEQNFWPALLSDRRDRVLTKTLNEVFSLDAESFQRLPNSQFTVLFQDYSLPLDVQGDGTRAAMRTLMTLSMLKGTLFMIEEPECHQHPGSLERFAGALCRLAKSQSVQIIVSTHSGECVRSFMQAANAAESSAAVFHLSLDNGKQEARRLDPEAVETLTNTGVDVRFLDLYA